MNLKHNFVRKKKIQKMRRSFTGKQSLHPRSTQSSQDSSGSLNKRVDLSVSAPISHNPSSTNEPNDKPKENSSNKPEGNNPDKEVEPVVARFKENPGGERSKKKKNTDKSIKNSSDTVEASEGTSHFLNFFFSNKIVFKIHSTSKTKMLGF